MASGRRSSEGEPESRTSSKSIINEKFPANVISSTSTSIIISGINGRKKDAIKLGNVSDEEISALILNPRGAVRQDNDGDAARMCIINDVLAEVLSANTFLVISDNDGIQAMVEGIMNEGIKLNKKVVVIRCIVVEVKSEHLVILSNDASFSSSRVVRENKTARVNVELEEESREGLTVVILTDEAGE